MNVEAMVKLIRDISRADREGRFDEVKDDSAQILLALIEDAKRSEEYENTPPSVCSGAGTFPTDYPIESTSIPGEGMCGICKSRVPIMLGQLPTLAVHPYRRW